jgi:molybdopterin-guanine dinucleotide biosynthesis protein A
MPGLVSHAAIIAGGASRRMGSCKALLDFQGQPLIAHVAGVLRPLFKDVVIVSADEAVARAARLPAIPDIFSGKGPLGGVHAALEYSGATTFCVACDLPFLQPDVIRFLCENFSECDVLAPRVHTRMEPLHAVYAPSCLPTLQTALQNERVPRVEKVLAPLRLCFIEENELRQFDPDLKFLTNLNTPEEARAAGISGML